MLPLQVKVDMGALAMKGYSTFPKTPALLKPHHQIVKCYIRDTHWWGSYRSAGLFLLFLAFWFICLTFFLVHFKNCSKYLTRGIVLVFIPFIRFLMQNLIFEKLLFFWGSPFLFFLSFPFVWWFLLLIFQSIYSFLFLQEYWRIPNWAVLFLPLFLFPFVSL